MRKITMLNWMSLDGFFARGDGTMDLDWTVQDPEVIAATHGGSEEDGDSDRPDTLILGNLTFQGLKESWLPFLDNPDAPELMQTFARELTGMRKVVFSRTVTGSDWANAEFPSGNIVEVVRELKSAEGGEILIMGSGTIVRQLTDARLIDSYIVIVTPVLLGQGNALFTGVDRNALALRHSRSFDSGNIVLTYGLA